MSRLALLAAFVATLVLWLAWTTIKASRARTTARAAYLSRIKPLFDRTVTRIEPTGFPRMTGHLGPHAFDIQVVMDSLTFRKLPALWVMLSLPEPLPAKATLNILARPTGQEPFSNFATLPQSLPPLDGLPEGTAIRSDDAANLPTAAILEPHLSIFADPKVKELLLSPKGIRLVILAEEADRGRFLIFRDAEMGMEPLRSSHLSPLIDTILALRQTLIEAS